MRANYQSYAWYNADKPILNLSSPNENGWTFNNEEELIPLMMTKLPATVIELTDCGCKGNCGNNNCNSKISSVQILANVVLNNISIVILMNNVTLVMKVVAEARSVRFL